MSQTLSEPIDTRTHSELRAEIGRLNTLIEDMAAEMHTNDVAAGLAQTVVSTEVELRDADLTVLDEFESVDDARQMQRGNPDSRIYVRTVTTTIARGEWAEVAA